MFVCCSLYLDYIIGRKRTMKKFKFLYLLVTIIAFLGTGSFSYAKSHSYNYSKIKGSNVNYIRLDMRDPSLGTRILNGANKITATEPLEKMARKVEAIAAINGTYFEAYGGTPVPWGTIIKDKKVLHVGNTGSVVGITENNRLIIDNLTISLKGYINGDYRAIPWRINHPSEEGNAITIFTPEYGGQVELEPGAKAVIVRNGIVTSIVESSFICPDDGVVISYNKDTSYLVDERYKIGDRFEYEHEFKTNHTSPEDWKQVVNALGAGPSLIINGKITADGEKEGFWEPKINTNRAARTFIGSTAEGEIIIGTIASATLKEAAYICQDLNLVNAMCLDGGGSLALYYKDKGVIVQGRNVNNGLAFVREEIKAREISVKIDGVKVNFDKDMGKPYIDGNGRTQVPLRAIMEAVGARVDWDEESRRAIIEKEGIIIEITIGEANIKVNGRQVENDTMAVINNGRTYLPIRIVLESLGYRVGWDERTKTIGVDMGPVIQ